MNILFIGDIFGSPGRRIVADHLEDIVKTNSIDLVIANAENSAGGFGITPSIAEDLLALGIDVLTSGNHVWDKREIFDYLGRQPRLLRPANYPEAPGRGAIAIRARNGVECAVFNLQGRTYMTPIDCPFRAADRMLAELDPAIKVKFVDFHAEVTSEKVAMGWYLDGRVSAVVGTHTHIPTADTRLLARRHGLPDRLRNDRAVRFGHRRRHSDYLAEIFNRIAGTHGGSEAIAGASRGDCGCG